MITFSVIAAFLQAGLFQWDHLIQKHLFDKGMEKLGIFYYQAFAIIPGFLLLTITYKQEYILFLAHHPKVLAAILFSSAVWMLHVYLRMFATEATHSMAFLNAFNAIITLPVYLSIGILMNNDSPNFFNFIALISLGTALYIQPTPHTENTKRSFYKKLLLLIPLSLSGHIIDAVNMGSYRYFFQNINATLFGLSCFMFLSMLVIVIFFLIKKQHRRNIQQDLKQYSYWIFIMPIIWVIGTFFEGYSVTNIPIYTLIAIASFTFLLDIFSDLKNKRIHLDLRSMVFILLVLLSTGLSVFSLYL